MWRGHRRRALNGGSRPYDGARHDALVALCLAVLLGLFAVAVAGVVPDEHGIGVAVHGSAGARAERGVDGRPAGGAAATTGGDSVTVLRFELPPTGGDGARWVLRLDRDAMESVQLRRGDWRSPVLGFFSRQSHEGALPSSFLFPLPPDWQGPVEVELRVAGGLRRNPAPRVMDEAQAMRLEHYGVAASAMIYASLFTIGLLALALFSAARDRMFLALFATILVALLALAAANGHLYQLPVVGAFAFWGVQGVVALTLLLCAAWLQMLAQYAGVSHARPGGKRIVDAATLVLVALVALCLLNLGGLERALQQARTVLFCVSLLLGLLLLVDAARRRVLMSWPLAVLAALTLVGVVMVELTARGHVVDSVLVRYGYQVGIVMGVALLSVGMIGRIGEYRHQRDRELLARADTERRMERESARSELASELQTQLRSLPVADIGWTAFRLLGDRLRLLLPVERCVVVAHGYHGHDVLVVDPVSDTEQVKAQVGKRQLALKRQATAGIALQQPVTEAGQPSIVAIEAMVPLQLQGAAWGAVLLQRAGVDGFATEELSLADDFARLALFHVDQAVSAANLRRTAEIDALTGSFNRRTVDQWLARTFSEGARQQWPVSVLFIDLDHFKSINDRHGHACGDACLRSVAAALRETLSEGDLFGRYGGEEFIVILPKRGAAAARAVAEQLRLAVENLHPEWNGQVLRLTVSVGIATRLEHEDAPGATLERADRALYSAKASGRNCVQVAPAVFR